MTIRLSDTPVIQTERLRLRAPEGRDVGGWTGLAVSDRARFIGGPLKPAQAFRAWGHVIGHWCLRGFGSFVIERKSDGEAIGQCGPWYPEGWPEREIGWVIWSPSDEGKGLAFEAAAATRDHAFRDLGWDSAVSYIDPRNRRSIALAERLGARRDTEAAAPGENEPKALVYRHPRPEALQ